MFQKYQRKCMKFLWSSEEVSGPIDLRISGNIIFQWYHCLSRNFFGKFEPSHFKKNYKSSLNLRALIIWHHIVSVGINGSFGVPFCHNDRDFALIKNCMRYWTHYHPPKIKKKEALTNLFKVESPLAPTTILFALLVVAQAVAQ
jgi:hypothetical protein